MSPSESVYPRGEHPDLAPPIREAGAAHWLRKNLFSSVGNGVITVLLGAVLVWSLSKLLVWALLTADFTGDSLKACTSAGACWAVVTDRFAQYWFGFFYPSEAYWRPLLAFALLGPALAPWLFELKRFSGPLKVFSLAYPLLAYWLMHGGVGLAVITTDLWGGFALTVVIGVTGIVVSLPIGILLALARQSELPVIRLCSVIFIEFIRGVPLITLLFVASFLLPLFLPEGMNFDKLVRVLIMVTLFSAAYMAEVVRGGLQAIPKGQIEAARALGLGYWQTMLQIVLPQALKIVIPGIVNTFIGLFKDTSLVAIVGLFDLLGLTQTILKDVAWIGSFVEAFLFIGLVYWVCCFAMSRYSQTLERRLDTGHRSND
ncbi:MAG: amino acid ABC transporter permease [Alphaproteobacteria bacterium]|nr:MAG: amino acid ABC transporter permease [Alphaproteobacteria bacterium]